MMLSCKSSVPEVGRQRSFVANAFRDAIVIWGELAGIISAYLSSSLVRSLALSLRPN